MDFILQKDCQTCQLITLLNAFIYKQNINIISPIES